MPSRAAWIGFLRTLHRSLLWGDRRIPRGARSVVGLGVAMLGLFGFLPVIGFWMLPLGLALIALDVPPLRRRLLAWLEKKLEAGD